MASTGVANVRELEDLIIEAIYAGLLDGKLNQRERVLRVSRCAPRDIRDSDIAAVALKLQRWHRNTQRVLTGLQALQVQLREDAASTRDSARAQNAKQRELLSELKKRNAAAVGGEEDVMELELDTRARYGGRARRRVEPNPERARLK
uniref:PCI domain-containing protein n=2 Tax=Phaeomonas parva TaxID=124430 RepID=A0A7S1UC22_9STRA|mmetsp:Transcript_40618/g.127059  ORF Transcript_40618/g.127059 Transcript_40618/m.127059 type:complete len:148 (+) Transcript_40618:686-1129(+)